MFPDTFIPIKDVPNYYFGPDYGVASPPPIKEHDMYKIIFKKDSMHVSGSSELIGLVELASHPLIGIMSQIYLDYEAGMPLFDQVEDVVGPLAASYYSNYLPITHQLTGATGEVMEAIAVFSSYKTRAIMVLYEYGIVMIRDREKPRADKLTRIS